MKPSAPVTSTVRPRVGIAELGAQSVELSFGPGGCIVAEHGWRVIVHAVRGLFAAVF